MTSSQIAPQAEAAVESPEGGSLQTRRERDRWVLLHHGAVVFFAALALGLSLKGLAVAYLYGFSLRQEMGFGTWLLATALVVGLGMSTVAYFRCLRLWVTGTWDDLSLAPFRWAFCSLVAGAALYVGLWQPYQPHTATVALALACGAFAALLLAIVGPRSNLRRRGRRAADFLLFHLCLLLVFSELGLRVLAQVRPSVLFDRPNEDVARRLADERRRPGVMIRDFPVNQGGFYDTEFVPKRAERNLVIAIGDSFSWGKVPLPFHFTSVAEEFLPDTDIYNMGLPGLGPSEYLYLLTNEALPLEPDVVVINIFAGNDFVEYLSPFESEDPLRGWLDQENLLVVQVPRRLAVVSEERQALPGGLAAPSVESLAPEGYQPPPKSWLREQYPWLEDPLQEQPSMTRRAFRRVEKDRVVGMMNISAAEFDRRFSPLLEMKRAAADVPLLFMLIPDEFQVDDILWDYLASELSHLELERDRPQRILGSWLEQHDLLYLDLLPILRDVAPMKDGRRHLYHLWDTHFNARGNQVTGQALAAFLRPYLETPRQQPEDQ